MDKELIRQRFAQARDTYTQAAFVQQQIGDRLLSLMHRHLPVSDKMRVLEIGCGNGGFTRSFLKDYRPRELWLNDLCPEVLPQVTPLLADREHFLPGDAEKRELPDGLDLIFSSCVLQWLDHPLAFLRQLNSHLTAGGWVALSSFGPDNLKEMQQLTDATLPYRSLKQLTEGLTDIYEVAVQEEEQIETTFDTPLALLHHLKATGVTGIRRTGWTKGKLAAFCHRYQEKFSNKDGQVRLTYHPLYLLLRKK